MQTAGVRKIGRKEWGKGWMEKEGGGEGGEDVGERQRDREEAGGDEDPMVSSLMTAF